MKNNLLFTLIFLVGSRSNACKEDSLEYRRVGSGMDDHVYQRQQPAKVMPMLLTARPKARMETIFTFTGMAWTMRRISDTTSHTPNYRRLDAWRQQPRMGLLLLTPSWTNVLDLVIKNHSIPLTSFCDTGTFPRRMTT